MILTPQTVTPVGFPTLFYLLCDLGDNWYGLLNQLVKHVYFIPEFCVFLHEISQFVFVSPPRLLAVLSLEAGFIHCEMTILLLPVVRGEERVVLDAREACDARR